MSLNGLFQTSRRAIQVLEAAIQTTGQNVANAGTEGYSRQRISTRADSLVTNGLRVQLAPGAFTGAGVSIQGYERLRDGLLEAAARDVRSGLGAAEEDVRTGTMLEGVLAAGTPGSLTESLASFWNAFADAADRPTDLSLRRVVQQRTDALAGAFQRHDDGLTRLAGETRSALASGVDQFNALTERIAGLNADIQSARSAGTPNFAAEDERDLLARDLAVLAPVRVTTDANGHYAVTLQGMALVQGATAQELGYVGPPNAAEDAIQFKGTSVAFDPGAEGGGRLGSWVRTLTSTIPETRADFDALAARLVADVNAAHGAGYGLDGSTGTAFFDPAGTTAATLARSSDIDDPAAIALAGMPDAPGDVSVALALADLREGFEEEAIGLTATVGRRLQHASATEAASSALVGHFAALSEGVSGVSLDEEMTRLIEYQQAYAAAARVITTAQSLFDTLLAL